VDDEELKSELEVFLEEIVDYFDPICMNERVPLLHIYSVLEDDNLALIQKRYAHPAEDPNKQVMTILVDFWDEQVWFNLTRIELDPEELTGPSAYDLSPLFFGPTKGQLN